MNEVLKKIAVNGLGVALGILIALLVLMLVRKYSGGGCSCNGGADGKPMLPGGGVSGGQQMPQQQAPAADFNFNISSMMTS